MKRFLDHAWFNFTRLFQWHRMLGISALCVAAYLVVFVGLGKTDMSWFLPPSTRPYFHWPDLPRFLAWRQTSGNAQEIIYTVPTRQITPQELAEIQHQPYVRSSSPLQPKGKDHSP
jgi:hypothetical protein